jgi:hypothetical protein
MNNYALQTDLAHRRKEMAKGFSLTHLLQFEKLGCCR